jgi:hypothetical protein
MPWGCPPDVGLFISDSPSSGKIVGSKSISRFNATIVTVDLRVPLQSAEGHRCDVGIFPYVALRLVRFRSRQISRGVHLEWHFFEPFAQRQDLDSPNMYLLIQPSFDETFNVVTADGIAEGVLNVTSSAIEWTPTSWCARCEDPSDIMRIGIGLLRAPAHAVAETRVGLKKYAQFAIHRWLEWLSGRPATAY